ncbi:MAG: hypothetical protein CVU13_07315 [Bacteroidetes bacterium HGW-Bacteroidetes-8]|jgi:hypothetical protein|nr:MAG: hypothetical protein CVU13_07315 [Bacteroidetes bacterium HGW-Bacteroidetes-8]
MRESRYNQNDIYKNFIKLLKGLWSADTNSGSLDNTNNIYVKAVSRIYNIMSKKEPDYEKILDRLTTIISSEERTAKINRGKRRLVYAAGLVAGFLVILNFTGLINFSLLFNNIFISSETRQVLSNISQVPKRHKATLIINDSSIINIEKDSVIYSGNHMDKSIVNKIAELNITDDQENQMHTLVVPRGGEFFLTLPDGTEVFLNSNSKLRYPCRFSETGRVVHLEGEAFFKVKHLDSIPFLVISDRSVTKVLGTEFNIKTDSRANQITLCEGLVEVEHLISKTRRVICPNEQATITDEQFNVEEVDSYEVRAWTEGRFYFKGKTLAEITDKLSDWYSVDFNFKLEKTKTIQFTGMINRNDILKDIFELFEASYDLKFQVNDSGVLIVEKRQ